MPAGGCGLLSAVVAGNTTFANLELTTSSGFLYQFESGSTQTVTGSLGLLGVLGSLLTIRSTIDGSEAFFDVQGTSTADFVDVQDNDARPGNHIGLGGNSVKGSNTPGWFLIALVPAVGFLGLALLGGWILVTARRVLRQQR